MSENIISRNGWAWTLASVLLTLVFGPLSGWLVTTTAGNRDDISVLKARVDWIEQEQREYQRRMEDKVDRLLHQRGIVQ
jgi:hypothetical protein